MGSGHSPVRVYPRICRTEAKKKERKKTDNPREGWEKERKKTDNPREGWEDGTPPPHRDFKEGTVWC